MIELELDEYERWTAAFGVAFDLFEAAGFGSASTNVMPSTPPNSRSTQMQVIQSHAVHPTENHEAAPFVLLLYQNRNDSTCVSNLQWSSTNSRNASML